MPDEQIATFEEVRSRAAARRRIASQETRRSHLEDIMASTLQRMAYNAEMKLRLELQAEFTKIIDLSDEGLNKRFCDEQKMDPNLPESSLSETVRHCVQVLKNNNMDLLHKALESDNHRNNTVSIAINTRPDQAAEVINLDSDLDSDAKESWLCDNNSEDEDLTILQQVQHLPVYSSSGGNKGGNDSGIFPGKRSDTPEGPRRSSRISALYQKDRFRYRVGMFEEPEDPFFPK